MSKRKLTDAEYQAVVNEIYERSGDEALLAMSQSVHLGGATWDDVVDHAASWMFSSAVKALTREVKNGDMEIGEALERMALHAFEVVTEAAYNFTDLADREENDE